MDKKLGIRLRNFWIVLLFLFFPSSAFADNMYISAGYGFALLNPERKPYHLRYTEGSYDFFHLSLAREAHIYKDIWFCVEPFIAYQIRPKKGLDTGFVLLGKYNASKGFYVNFGAGIAYTSYGFEEQGTHFPFILQGGIGYRRKNFFIEDRFKHY